MNGKRCLDGEMESGGVRVWGSVVWIGVELRAGLGGCVVWVLQGVLLSRFKASSITNPGGGLT